MKKTSIGYLVVESCEDYEQTLALDKANDKPEGGILDWRSKGGSSALFRDRKSAQLAINRTEHYRLAFSTNHPERKNCKIVPVSTV